MITDGMVLKICGFRIPVFLRSEEYMGGDEGRFNDNHTIFVKEELSLPRQWEALWHEIIHAVSDTKGLGLSEEQVRDLSITQHQIFGDNKILIKGLKEELEDAEIQ